MNNNLLIGLVVGAVIILGGIALVVYGPSSGDSVATSTPSTANNNTTTPPPSGDVTTFPTTSTGTLVVATNSMAVVTGRVTPNGAQTSYWYEYGPMNTLGSRTTAQTIGSGFVSISAPAIISGLSANATYYYRLAAQNGYGTVSGQISSFKTNSNPPLQGIGPTSRTDTATAITRTTASLNGRVTPNSFETSYWFEYGETNDFGNTTSLQSAGKGTTPLSVSAELSDLKPLTKYYFRVNAQNQFGTMTGGTMAFTTTGPVASIAPTVVTTSAGSVATSSVVLRGRLNPNSYPTTYWFEYGTDSSLISILDESNHTVLTGSATVTVNVSADVKNLLPDTRYYYQLIAVNAGGTSQGDIMAFTTKKLLGNN